MRRLATLWLRAQAWLRREAYVRAVVAEATKRAYMDGHSLGFTLGQQAGYQVGRAHGELIGRENLALELQVAHGADEGGERNMTAEELGTLRIRQLH